ETKKTPAVDISKAVPCFKCKANIDNDNYYSVVCDLWDSWAHTQCLMIPAAQLKLLLTKVTALKARLSAFEKRFNERVQTDPTSSPDFTMLVQDAVQIMAKRAKAVLYGLPDSDDDLYRRLEI
uniref:Zinc finger PHD-type domain-containing protein n=1 Tax=Romanomermis culicivorax TaxID=13658 RepID=A0A915KXK8_ROMCU